MNMLRIIEQNILILIHYCKKYSKRSEKKWWTYKKKYL